MLKKLAELVERHTLLEKDNRELMDEIRSCVWSSTMRPLRD
jgi:hypothetical protein